MNATANGTSAELENMKDSFELAKENTDHNSKDLPINSLENSGIITDCPTATMIATANGTSAELENMKDSFELANENTDQNSKDLPINSLENSGIITDNAGGKVEEDISPDDILHQLGGCGTFQFLLVLIIHSMKTVVCWSMSGNAFFAYTPRWKCVDDITAWNESSSPFNSSMTSGNSSLDDEWTEQCTTETGKPCTRFEFEVGTKTLVTEFDLVCGYSWVPATITSLQMVGMCVGSLVAGQLGDMFGRRAPIFSSMVLLFIFHLVSYFATTWIVLAAARVFIGIGCAFYLSSCYTVMTEYSLSKWRSVVTGLPSWAIESSLFSLMAWWLRDWKDITLAMVVISLVTLSAWLYVPESFRWYITQKKFDQAEALVNRVSKWNKHPAPDFQRFRAMVSKENATTQAKKYSVLVLFRRLALLKITLPLMMIWFTMGFVSYGINFAVQKLSGDIYLNVFLFSIASTPSKFISIFLQNKFGRKFAACAAFCVCLLGGLTVGIIQYIDTPIRDSLTNYCALAASVGVDGTWGPLQTITLELYPTVVRNTGFGFVSIFARIGAVIGPQFVFLSEMVPGLLYFVVAVMSCLSILGTCLLPETRNTTLNDELGQTARRRKETSLVAPQSPLNL